MRLVVGLDNRLWAVVPSRPREERRGPQEQEEEEEQEEQQAGRRRRRAPGPAGRTGVGLAGSGAHSAQGGR